MRSAVFGAKASAVGYIHNDPTKDEFNGIVDRGFSGIKAANGNSARGSLSFEELRKLKNRNEERLVELAYALNNPID